MNEDDEEKKKKLFEDDDTCKVLVRDVAVVVDVRDRARPGLAKKTKTQKSIESS